MHGAYKVARISPPSRSSHGRPQRLKRHHESLARRPNPIAETETSLCRIPSYFTRLHSQWQVMWHGLHDRLTTDLVSI
ncbi:hypothetical protein BU25DRAFT_416267 [Macroventuria anomochaeta]|uniref:Uncharacterized protein n=1 Tax=Macroventuria anomochaeta TaxID=301207 RepID=A0ACB6RHS1_9PLEO|nr:uncharacterized protein BU25DRAFT_416267 [Macroventuria anomochaeta]KAF2621242.1 hypothetical protein BU25DRAFT_416267 [Macroventuria anomochaeta]